MFAGAAQTISPFLSRDELRRGSDCAEEREARDVADAGACAERARRASDKAVHEAARVPRMERVRRPGGGNVACLALAAGGGGPVSGPFFALDLTAGLYLGRFDRPTGRGLPGAESHKIPRREALEEAADHRR